MGLFGNLFEKKNCSICGKELGLLGVTKLSDGYLCKECASKLSPWFSSARSSTVEQIEKQLEYREANKEAVAAFNVTRVLGEGTKVYLDEDKRKFFVTDSSNYRNANPDVLDFSQVTGCNIDIDEDKTELYIEGPDNKRDSYNPRQYDYSYAFYVTIQVNSPYFSQIRFRLNDLDITIKNELASNIEYREPVQPKPAQAAKPGVKVNRPSAAVKPAAHAGVQAKPPVQPPHPPVRMPSVAFKPDLASNVEYNQYKDMANEIKTALTEIRTTTREEVSAVKMAVTCPHCGATGVPDANGCCEFCGGALQ